VFNFSFCFKSTVLCVAVLISAALPAQEDKVRVGVLTLESRATVLGKSVTDRLINELGQNRNYQLSPLDKTTLDLSAAKEDGFDYIVRGAIEASHREEKEDGYRDKNNKWHPAKYRTVFNIVLNVTALDVESGKVEVSASEADRATTLWSEERPRAITADNYSSYLADYLRAAEKPITKVAFAIVSQIHPLEPSVIKISGKELTLDMGRNDGITEKQRFVIVREGDPLYDRNGDLISVDVKEIAYVTITRVESKVAFAKIEKVMKDPNTGKSYEINLGDLARMQDRTKGRTAGEKMGGLFKDLLK